MDQHELATNGWEVDIERDTRDPSSNTTAKDKNLRDHKDSLNRYLAVKDGPNRRKDHYLRPDDGKLHVLKVQTALGYKRQATRDPWDAGEVMGENRSIRDIPLSILRWTYESQIKAEREKARGGEVTPTNDLMWKYPIACLGLTFTAWLHTFNIPTQYGGNYPPVLYRDFCYPKSARNPHENRPEVVTHEQSHQSSRRRLDDGNSTFARHLRPRKLCVITSYNDSNPGHFKYEIKNTDQWDRDRPSGQTGEYVFVSYTRQQYQTYAAEEIDGWDIPSPEAQATRLGMKGLYKEDLDQLCKIGVMAAHKAGLFAFWIDVLCIDKPDKGRGLDSMDSHRICDVARGANRMVIAIKDAVTDRISQQPSSPKGDLLKHWATRLWTLPEMLLAPTVHDLEVYHSDSHSGEIRSWDTIPKRNMAERAYPDDGVRIRELVDHFESSLHLTQIELLTIGLECLSKREKKLYSNADIVYALMTLARRRPIPYEGQSLFEAFAQLSLMNDSNLLLERLICLLPPRQNDPWLETKDFTEDFWNVRLWDIIPSCQVAGIADEDQTVLIDGAFGASIEWKKLKKVAFLKRKNLWRMISDFLIQIALAWLLMAIILLASLGPAAKSPEAGSLLAAPIIFFIISIICVALLPYAMLAKYRGKFWSTQAIFFGMEGVPDLDQLEKELFGFSEGRLTWSPHGSTLSQHQPKLFGERLSGECEALQPLLTNDDNDQTDTDNHTRTFTLVDTYAMTVMTFKAVHPPSVALVLGHEGGMRRTALCSYNYETQTFHRETIVRIPTKNLDRMYRVNKFRFTTKSWPLNY